MDLLGSLGATGRGHNTDRAVLLGLVGHDPATVATAVVESILPEISRSGTLTPAGGTPIPFDIARDIRFLPKERLPYHVNALTIRAWGGSPSSARGDAAPNPCRATPRAGS